MRRSLGRAYAWIWSATMAGVVLELAGLQLLNAGMPSDPLAATPRTVLELLLANVRVACWPLALLALGWDRHRVPARAGDVLVKAQLLGNGLVVGNVLGQHPRLAHYLPHLPLEWLAISLPAAAWTATRSAQSPRLWPVAAATLTALVGAALIETYLVPFP